jgi:hypothetical protein
MCPRIDLDDDVFEYLQSRATPFVDTPSTVLRRELRLPEASPSSPTQRPVASLPSSSSVVAESPVWPKSGVKRKPQKSQKKKSSRQRTRAAAGTLLPEDRYIQPLLRVLDDAGGKAPFRDVVDAFGELVHDEFLPADFETLDSGGIRWQSRLQFVRLRLVERGLLERDSPRGIWILSEAGRQELKELEESRNSGE